jgi:hypothetical protein
MTNLPAVGDRVEHVTSHETGYVAVFTHGHDAGWLARVVWDDGNTSTVPLASLTPSTAVPLADRVKADVMAQIKADAHHRLVLRDRLTGIGALVVLAIVLGGRATGAW